MEDIHLSQVSCPEIGLHKPKEMEKYKSKNFKNKYGLKYTDEYKHMVCQAYLNGSKTKADIWREYIGGDSEHGNLTKWLIKLGYLRGSEYVSIPPVIHMPKKEPSKSSIEELEKKVRELERSLENSQLQSHMYKRMIELAEEQLKIDIQKKSNTK